MRLSVGLQVDRLFAGGLLSDDYVSPDTTRNTPAGRAAGIVLHPTSLDGPYGCGDLGDATHAFVDWLASAGMKAWQVLPLVPPDEDYFSPYSGQDALCGNPSLICVEYLVKEGLLDAGASPWCIHTLVQQRYIHVIHFTVPFKHVFTSYATQRLYIYLCRFPGSADALKPQ